MSEMKNLHVMWGGSAVVITPLCSIWALCVQFMWSEAINMYFSCASIEMWITLVGKDLFYNLYESAAIANAFWASHKSIALPLYLWAIICKVQSQILKAKL